MDYNKFYQKTGINILQKSTGSLTINSIPENANVYIDDEYQYQQTPIIFTDVSIGEHLVRLELEGYESWYIFTNININENTELNAELNLILLPQIVPKIMPQIIPQTVPQTVPQIVPQTVPQIIPQIISYDNDIIDIKNNIVDIKEEIRDVKFKIIIAMNVGIAILLIYHILKSNK